jgi:hypothetical protein
MSVADKPTIFPDLVYISGVWRLGGYIQVSRDAGSSFD